VSSDDMQACAPVQSLKESSSMNKEVAVVTGSAHGLGREIAQVLAAGGAKVAVADFDGTGAEAVAVSIRANGGLAEAFPVDVRSSQQINSMFDKVLESLGTPTILVNNAGIYPDHTIMEMSEEAWDLVLDTNLKSVFLSAQAFMRRRGENPPAGAIVNLSSTAGFSARIGAGHYSASKAGVGMLTKSMAQEFGPLGVRVNCVAPGLIFLEEKPVNPEYAKSFVPMIPLGHIGQPSDVASVVAFLVSPAARFVTGTIIPVDGGFLTGRTLVRPGSDRSSANRSSASAHS
jgi:NAD(P)-dependent dehydrogenase (short-subunit alcohol dehydrogenase family)